MVKNILIVCTGRRTYLFAPKHRNRMPRCLNRFSNFPETVGMSLFDWIRRHTSVKLSVQYKSTENNNKNNYNNKTTVIERN